MIFNSFPFVYLVLATLCLYYLPGFRRWQVGTLIAASLGFYAYGQPALLALLLGSASINAAASYGVAKGAPERRRAFAVLGVAANLLVLAFFKYSPLVAVTLFPAGHAFGDWLLAIPLPIGISFFTFQGISLAVDVFRQQGAEMPQVQVQAHWRRHWAQTVFFIAFFPQLVAGPIVKAHDFFPQIGEKRWRDIAWEPVFRHLVLGYFLKMVVADNLKDFTVWMAFPYFQTYSSGTLIWLLFGYSCQIFADFAGYSLIAIGLARLFGYRLPMNFNYPYISTSFSEFWRRWHISLSSFLKEYLYIPMGGNRKGAVRTYLHLMATMFLGGLWHGAAWSYAVWGTFHGSALAVERWVQGFTPWRAGKVLRVLKGFMVFGFVTLAWLLFRLPEFGHAVAYLEAMAANAHLPLKYTWVFNIALYALPVAIYHAFHLFPSLRERLRPYDAWAYGGMLFLIAFNSGAPGAFIYFQF